MILVGERKEKNYLSMNKARKDLALTLRGIPTTPPVPIQPVTLLIIAHLLIILDQPWKGGSRASFLADPSCLCFFWDRLGPNLPGEVGWAGHNKSFLRSFLRVFGRSTVWVPYLYGQGPGVGWGKGRGWYPTWPGGMGGITFPRTSYVVGNYVS